MKKPTRRWVCQHCRRLVYAFDVTGFQALRADIRTFDLTIQFDGGLLHIGTEHTIGNAMRMAHVMASTRGFPANFTNLGHLNHSTYNSIVPTAIDKKPEYYTTSTSGRTRIFHVLSQCKPEA